MENLELVQGDMMNKESLVKAIEGVEVVSPANCYKKESISADIEGNKNLIEAAKIKGIKRFVFLSIVDCENAPNVPHFHAKKIS